MAARLASPLFRFQFTVVTLRRSLIRIYFGINEASLLRHDITAMLVVPSPLS